MTCNRWADAINAELKSPDSEAGRRIRVAVEAHRASEAQWACAAAVMLRLMPMRAALMKGLSILASVSPDHAVFQQALYPNSGPATSDDQGCTGDVAGLWECIVLS